MTGDDIVTRQHLTRFDMEIGAGVAEGMEDQIGILSNTNGSVKNNAQNSLQALAE